MVKATLPKRTRAFEFSLSSIFVDYYMPKANAAFVKVYLYGVRRLFAGESLSTDVIARHLDMLKSDVIGAWKYWDSVGVVRYTEGESESAIEFLELRVPEDEKDSVPENAPAALNAKLSAADEKPLYLMSEITGVLKGNKDLSDMLMYAQEILEKPLTQNDIRTLYSFYDWLALPAEVILMLLEHCISMGKTSMRYMEKVAIAWSENGLNTAESAQRFLTERTQKKALLKKYERLFKIKNRSFSDGEAAYILKWLETLSLPEDWIIAAYEKTIAYTGKLSFPYMDKILSSWKESGGRDDAPQKSEKEKKIAPKKKSKKCTFTDYAQRSDEAYSQLETASINHIKNLNKGDRSV